MTDTERELLLELAAEELANHTHGSRKFKRILALMKELGYPASESRGA